MFKFYKNKKTHHPSISIRQRDKRKWHNIPISHSKPKNDTFIQIDDPHPKAKQNDKSYIRKYIRIDKRGVKATRIENIFYLKNPNNWLSSI